MNGETPSVPITTLAGVASLTDLLPQLPLPTPLPQTVQNKSLLYNPNIAEDARKLLASSDERLGSHLAHALRQTNISQIELKDTLNTNTVEGDIPLLLQTIIRKDPHIFQGNAHLDGIHPHATQYGSYIQHGHRISNPPPLHSSPHSFNQHSSSSRQNHSQSPRYQSNLYTSPNNSPYPATSAGSGHSSSSIVSHNHQLNAVASPTQATAAERVLPHSYAHQVSNVLSQNSTDPHARHNRRQRNTPSISNDNTDQQYHHGMKSQEPVQKPSGNLPNRTNVQGALMLPEPVIVLDDIGSQITPTGNISRLPLPAHLACPPVKNSEPTHQKSKSVEPAKKNEPVVMLEMLDPSVLMHPSHPFPLGSSQALV